MKLLQPVGKKLSFQRAFLSSNQRQASYFSIAKATLSSPMPCMHVPPAPIIDEKLLRAAHEASTVIEQGYFGSCNKMIYKDIFVVCSKKLNDEVSLPAMKSEAAVLFALNDGPYTPHCFGFCVSLHSIIMVCIHVEDKPVSLQSLVSDKNLLVVPMESGTHSLQSRKHYTKKSIPKLHLIYVMG